MSKVALDDVIEAQKRHGGRLPVTPLTYSPVMSEKFGREVYFKWENKFTTGSFKERGALNVLLSMNDQNKLKGVCAASAGNHALALSYHAAKLKIPCQIFMPLFAPLVKVQRTEATGAKVTLTGASLHETISTAKEFSTQMGLLFVSPFDDAAIVAGQGTCGLEICERLSDFDAVVVPVGGGGCIAGIATVIRAERPKTFILGVQSDWVQKIRQQQNKRAVLTTIADGIAVKEIGAIPGPIIQSKVDQLISVNDEEVADSIVRFLDWEKTVVEGGGAVGLSGLIQGVLPERCKKVVVVVTGSNIDMNLLCTLIERNLVRRGRWLRIATSVPDKPGNLNHMTGIIAQNGANVLDVAHDRFATTLGMVDIKFLLEVRDTDHGEQIKKRLREEGVHILDN